MGGKQIANPYDFANAVESASLFAGREAQLAEVDYYLGQGLTSTRPVHLAVVGPRGAGKTSLLNMVAAKGSGLGFCVVRINLDEGDVTTSAAFFQKLLDAVLSVALQAGAFGGKEGEVYLAYLNAIFGHQITPEALGGLVFPVQYALSASAGALDIPVSDSTVAADLKTIQQAVDRPMLLIIDEANVLGENRVVLQKLRNVLLQTHSYLVVISGTPYLFPKIDEVFSPVSRQFKRIVVDAFADVGETEDCILRPLKVSGLAPSRFWDFGEYPQNVRDIHELTGGRPYEIQRLCHEMFRRVQERHAEFMVLDATVLEDVVLELETERPGANRPIMAAIRALSARGLQALSTLVACNGTATFEQLWEVEYMLAGMSQWNPDDLRQWVQKLTSEGVLALDQSGRIVFEGDDADRIYATLRGRAHRVNVAFPPMVDPPLDSFLFVRLLRDLVSEGCHSVGPITSEKRKDALSDEAILDMLNALAGVTPAPDLLERRHRLTFGLYELLMYYRDRAGVPALRVTARWSGRDFVALFAGPGLLDEDHRSDVVRRLELIHVRAGELGAEFSYETVEIPVYRVDMVTRTMENSGPERLRSELANWHAAVALHAYVRHHDGADALFHADLACRYGVDLGALMANNLGYIFLVAGEQTMARKMFASASNSADGEPYQEGLVTYNQGILCAQQGDFESALTKLRRSGEMVAVLDEEGRMVRYLLIGVRKDGRLQFEERERPDLLLAARETAAAISNGKDERTNQ